MTQPLTAQNQINQAVEGIPQQSQPNLSFNQQQTPNICPNCGTLILPNFKFCPNCGKQLEKGGITVARQIYIYAMSVAVPPIGLYWGIKYFFSPIKKLKIIGAVAAVLTIISLIITIQLSVGLFKQIQSALNLYQSLPTGNLPAGTSPAELQFLK